MDIQESNKLIATFMGDESWNDADCDGGNHFLPDWNDLMPVVERIEGLQVNGRYIDVEMLPDATLIGFQEWEKEEAPIVNVNKSGEFDGLFETRLQGTYEAVVAFIKWYNQNK